MLALGSNAMVNLPAPQARHHSPAALSYLRVNDTAYRTHWPTIARLTPPLAGGG